MKSILGSVASILLGAVILSAATGCKVACKESEEEKGGECTAKSLTYFTGTPVSKSTSYAAGDGIVVDGVYGHVNIEGGAPAGTIVATFEPFDYQGYDEEDIAQREMNESLDLSLGGTGNVGASASRHDSSNGLGAHISIQLPPEFDGPVDVNNRGNGPIGNHNEFNVNVKFVGTSQSINVKGGASLGDCYVTGSSTVTTTTVDCGHVVSVKGVSDNLNLTSREGEPFDEPTIIFELVGISDTSSGGNITAVDNGPIDGTFPAGATFAIQAYAPNNGVVDTGNVPSNCTIQEADPPSPSSKTVNCGTSPIYKLTTNGETDSVFANGNIYLHFK